MLKLYNDFYLSRESGEKLKSIKAPRKAFFSSFNITLFGIFLERFILY